MQFSQQFSKAYWLKPRNDGNKTRKKCYRKAGYCVQSQQKHLRDLVPLKSSKRNTSTM